MTDIINPDNLVVSKAESIASRYGAVIVKEIASIGSIKGSGNSILEVSAFRFYSVVRDCPETAFGIRICALATSIDSAREFSTLIDQEHLEGMIGALQVLQERLNSVFKGVERYTEVFYTTHHMFRVGFYAEVSSVPEPTAFCSFGDANIFLMPPERIFLMPHERLSLSCENSSKKESRLFQNGELLASIF